MAVVAAETPTAEAAGSATAVAVPFPADTATAAAAALHAEVLARAEAACHDRKDDLLRRDPVPSADGWNHVLPVPSAVCWNHVLPAVRVVDRGRLRRRVQEASADGNPGRRRRGPVVPVACHARRRHGRAEPEV